NELPSMEVRARLLFAQGKKKDAVQLVEARSAKRFTELKDPSIFLQASAFFEEMNETAAAEAAIRRFVSESGSRNPRAIFPLMEFLSGNGRSSEAIQLCEQAWDRLPVADAAAAAVAAFLMGPLNEEDFRRLETRLTTAAQQYPNEVRIPMA